METWSVTAQQQQTAQDSTGNYVAGVKVTFVTGSGLSGSVFVPESQYNAETVRAMVAARVEAMAAIAALNG